MTDTETHANKVRKKLPFDMRGRGDCPERAGFCWCAQNAAHDSLDWLVARITELERQLAAPRMGMTVVPSDQYEREKLRADGAEARANTLTEALRVVAKWDYHIGAELGHPGVGYEAPREFARAALAAVTTQEPAPPEAHEGMVTVYHADGRYAGCMGVGRWERLLAEDAREEPADEWFIPEGDRQCGVVHKNARATCMKRRGHDGSHATPQGTWIDGPWCEYPQEPA